MLTSKRKWLNVSNQHMVPLNFNHGDTGACVQLIDKIWDHSQFFPCLAAKNEQPGFITIAQFQRYKNRWPRQMKKVYS